MKFTLPVALVAFLLGYAAGRADLFPVVPGDAVVPEPGPRAAADSDPGPPMDSVAPADAAGSQTSGFAARVDDRGLPSAAELEAYAALRHAGDAERADRLRDALLARLREAGRGSDTLAVAQWLAEVDPADAAIRLLQSELLQQLGRLEEALEPLLAVLAAGDGSPFSSTARDQLRLLVNVLESQRANRGDHPGLIRLFEHLVVRDPGYDGHRVRLARWLLYSGQIDAADRVAREMGASGVSDAEREDLLAALAVAREGLPLERSARGLHVRATVAGRSGRFLVDTGASTTVVSAAFAQALGSRPVRADVGVRTAGGQVRGALHRVRDFRVGGLHVPELEVLVLEHVPPDADGLLGMDVLGRVPPGMLPSALLGTSPASG